MGGTVTEVVSIVIRRVNVFLPAALASLPTLSTIPLGRGEGLPWRLPRPDLTVGREGLCHHLPLGLVLEEVPEEPLLLGVILPYAPKTALHETLDVDGIESQTEIEALFVVAVVLTDCTVGHKMGG